MSVSVNEFDLVLESWVKLEERLTNEKKTKTGEEEVRRRKTESSKISSQSIYFGIKTISINIFLILDAGRELNSIIIFHRT